MKRITFATHDHRALKISGTQQLLTGLVFAVVFVFVAPHRTLVAAGPDPVNLGSAAHFTILAGAAITTTGGGIINGDVGASPITGSAIHLPQAQVNGTIYAVDAGGPAGSVIAPSLLTTAKGDLTMAFNDAAGRTPIPSGPFLNPGAGNLGGLNLVPGLYKFTGTALITGSDVTLTGGPDDVWIFQIADDLEVGSTIHVILAGGAQARNVFWQVGTSATIGTFAVFKGTIIADQAITMNTTSVMDGRALAFTAGVTFNGDVGVLPTPKAPLFISVSRTPSHSATVVLNTTPFFLVTLQTSPDLSAPNWTTIATNTPVTSTWAFTDDSATATVTQRFYRAFLSNPN
jgi:Ice-binding-like